MYLWITAVFFNIDFTFHIFHRKIKLIWINSWQQHRYICKFCVWHFGQKIFYALNSPIPCFLAKWINVHSLGNEVSLMLSCVRSSGVRVVTMIVHAVSQCHIVTITSEWVKWKFWLVAMNGITAETILGSGLNDQKPHLDQ